MPSRGMVSLFDDKWQMTCFRSIMPDTLDATYVTPEVLSSLREIVPEEDLFVGEKTEKFSKDFYWYSPILKKELEDKRAEAAIRIKSQDQLRSVVSLLAKAKVPISLRGGGSGNYGQLIPLYGGVVLDLNGLNQIFSVEEVVHAEPGANLGKIEIAAREVGWEMRCLPSTWMISSLGGFLCGGSGGIGSIRYGGIATPGTVKSLTLMTVEEEPRLIKLEEEACLSALHTYGTTGIVVEIEMRLAPAIPWEQLIFVADDWHQLLAWSYDVASDNAIAKRLVTVFEGAVPAYFKPLRKHIPEGHPTTFLLVGQDDVEKTLASAEAAGIRHVYSKPFGDPPKPPFITDYTWNHTTLWAIKADPTITYLQCGFGEDFTGNLDKIKAKYGDEFLIHLELTMGNAKFGEAGATVGVGGIPLIRFTTPERLREIIQFIRDHGMVVSDPHTYVLEGGGWHPDIESKHRLKDDVDPHALLNPGKLGTYPKNPFAPANA